jgi:hypothetical protein
VIEQRLGCLRPPPFTWCTKPLSDLVRATEPVGKGQVDGGAGQDIADSTCFPRCEFVEQLPGLFDLAHLGQQVYGSGQGGVQNLGILGQAGGGQSGRLVLQCSLDFVASQPEAGTGERTQESM